MTSYAATYEIYKRLMDEREANANYIWLVRHGVSIQAYATEALAEARLAVIGLAMEQAGETTPQPKAMKLYVNTEVSE